MGKAKRGRPIKPKSDEKTAMSETYLVNTNEEKDSVSPQKTINVRNKKEMEENEESEGTEENEVIDNEEDDDEDEGEEGEEDEDEDEDEDEEIDEEENIFDDDTEEDNPESNDENLTKEIPKSKTLSKKKIVSIVETTPDKKSAKGGGSKEPKANLAKVMKAKGKDQKTNLKTGKSSLKSSSTSKQEPMLEIVLKGLMLLDERKGVSLPSIKKFVLEYEGNDQNWNKVRVRVRNSLALGLQDNLILRPKSNENVNGMQGSFKINKKEYNSWLAAKKKQLNPISKRGPPPKSPQAKSSKASKSESSTETKVPRPKTTKNSTKLVSKSNVSTKTKNLKVSNDSEPRLKKSAPKSKLRRSISNTDIALKKKVSAKKKLARAQSLEELAPTSKKIKTGKK